MTAVPPLALGEIEFGEGGLHRPECVLATRAGNLYVSDVRGGISRIAADGERTFFGQAEDPAEARFKPNGFAMRPDGSFLFANQGEAGGVFEMCRDGQARPYLLEVDGLRLGPTNFVLIDARERVWISVSTRRRERHSFRRDTPDGFIALVDDKGARIAADGFVWTNEFRFDAAAEWLYVCETMAKRLVRLRLLADGGFGPHETVAEFGAGDFPDGLTLDAEGSIWITSPVSNRLWRVTPDGEKTLLLEDADVAHIDEVERQLSDGSLRGPKIHEVHSKRLPNLTSLAFGGPDLKTAYMGVISGDAILSFQSPVAGLAMAHWDWD